MTFVRLKRMRTSASSKLLLGLPTASMRTEPIDLASAGSPSPTPAVRFGEAGATGLHEAKASGAPCVLFGLTHGWAAGTSGTRNGVAPFGRTDRSEERRGGKGGGVRATPQD